MLDFGRLDFRYDPFPIGYATGVVDTGLYAELSRSWPSTELFRYMPELGEKYSLSEVNNPDRYYDFLRSTDPWQRMYTAVKQPNFIYSVLDHLSRNRIELMLRERFVSKVHHFTKLKRKLKEQVKRIGLWMKRKSSLRARFEFSMMRGDGGSIKPHTDSVGKHVTLVMSAIEEGEWRSDWGGGTSVLKPKDPGENFNWQNRQLEFDDVEEIHKYPFRPNQCIVFVKTFNSLHGVYDLKGPSNAWRKTLTINIEDA